MQGVNGCVCNIYFQIRPQPNNLKKDGKHSNILLCNNKVMQKMITYCLTSFLFTLNNFYFCEIVHHLRRGRRRRVVEPRVRIRHEEQVETRPRETQGLQLNH